MAGLRILIADDDPLIRMDLKQTLDSLGYTVVAEAGDGVEAIAMALEQKPDLCILDVKMPEMDGIEAMEKIYEAEIAPCILLTAYSDRELVERARQSGAFAYLIKPFKPNDLPPAIEVARARFDQEMALRREIGDLQERLVSRKLVDRAKGILMRDHGMTEAEAYRRIQVQSMNTRKTMKEIAEAIILAHGV
jgi:AmiR/NasT family two-component response regulator